LKYDRRSDDSNNTRMLKKTVQQGRRLNETGGVPSGVR
jgi:hypothetical protein